MRSVRARQSGFSLIELMIVVAIIAIISSIALPSYQSYIQKVRRGDAQAALAALASAMERYYVDNRTFVGATAAQLYSDKVPVDGGATHYDLAIANATRRDFTLSATPAGAQEKDKCGTLSLSRNGVKGVKNNSLPLDQCWRS